MKNLALIFGLLILCVCTLFTSCSKCYTCTTQETYINITPSGDTVTTTAPVDESICTANQAEIDTKESEGAVCVPSS